MTRVRIGSRKARADIRPMAAARGCGEFAMIPRQTGPEILRAMLDEMAYPRCDRRTEEPRRRGVGQAFGISPGIPRAYCTSGDVAPGMAKPSMRAWPARNATYCAAAHRQDRASR